MCRIKTYCGGKRCILYQTDSLLSHACAVRAAFFAANVLKCVTLWCKIVVVWFLQGLGVHINKTIFFFRVLSYVTASEKPRERPRVSLCQPPFTV